MSYLKDLTVSKVSFVRKAANKRKFLLLKADDSDSDSSVNVPNTEEYIPMRKEVKEAMINILKSASSATDDMNVVDMLKADINLKLTESEAVEVADYVDVVKMTAAEKKKLLEEDKKLDAAGTPHKDKINDNDEDNVKKMAKETEPTENEKQLLLKIDSLTSTLETLSKESKRRDIVSWLQKECPFLPDDVTKTADEIMELDAANPTLAERYRTTLKKASVAMQQSNLFTEQGVSTDVLLKSESEGFDLIQKFNNDLQTLKKSANGNVSSADIVNLVKQHGSEYNNYRKAHILRAKRDAI
jgi:hypothetical protein